MLRGFLLIFLLASIVIVAICGFRGEHSPRTPWEIFPDMVRQQKVRAQSPIDFLLGWPRATPSNCEHGADWLRNAKAAVEGAAWKSSQCGAAGCRTALVSVSASARIITIPARWGTIGARAFQFRSRDSSCSAGSSVSISTVPFVMV